MKEIINAMEQALAALETIRPQNMTRSIYPAKIALIFAMEKAKKLQEK